MTKAEIISHIIDRITDPWCECPEDYRFAEPICLECAADLLKQYFTEDAECDLPPEDRMPKETTPALYMEAYNCYIRYQKHELRVNRLASYIESHELVCEYVNYYKDFDSNAIDLYPVDYLWESFPFEPIGDMSPDNPLFLIELGQRSADFNPGHEYCWYDREHNQLHSTNHPFRDGTLDAEAFARFALDDKETLEYFIDGLMDEDDIMYIFGCTTDELKKEVNL